jgi:MIP family channel proteins
MLDYLAIKPVREFAHWQEEFAHRREGFTHRQEEGTVEATTTATLVAEFVGTAILVFAIATTVTAAALQQAAAGFAYGTLGIVLVHFFVLAALVSGLAHISGAHFNPAVTVAMAVMGKLRWRMVPGYIAVQMVGAILGALGTELVYGGRAVSATGLASPAPSGGVSTGQAFVVELLITFVLVIVVIAVATDRRVPQGVAPVAIGGALAAAVFIGAPLTGAGVNPARALGPMIAAGALANWWLYLIAPIIGGLLAGGLYRGVLMQTRPAVASQPEYAGGFSQVEQ